MRKKPIMKESSGKRCGGGVNTKTLEKSKKAGSTIGRKRVSRTVGALKAGYKIKAQERKRGRRSLMEEFLKNYAPELKAIVNSSPIPQFVIDSDHRILFWNRTLEAISRIKAEDVFGTKQQWKAFYNKRRPTMADMLIDGDIKGISNWYGGKSSKSKYVAEAYECTDFFPNLGRKGLWLFFTAALVKDTRGNVIGAVETLEDITERKHAEDALRESEERFRQLVEHAGEVIVVAQNNMLKYANPMTTMVTGFSEKELYARPFVDFIHPEDRALVAERYQKRISGADSPPVYQFRLMNKDGSVRWVEINSVLIMWDKSPATLNFIQDITARRMTEEALRESENKYRELVENANSIILRMDTMGTVIFFNEFAQNFFGYKASEILGKNVVGTIVPETDSSGKDMGCVIREIAGNPEKYQSNENENIKKNGDRIWVSWTNKIIQDKNGKVKEILCIGNDITGHKKSEDALKHSEMKFRELADFLPEIVFELDAHGKVTYVNRVAYTLLGYSPGDMKHGLSLFDMLISEDRDRGWMNFKNILNGTRTAGNEYMMCKKDGSTIPVIIHSRAIKPGGAVTGVRGIVVDITDRKKAENSIRESEEKFRRLFEDSGIAQLLFNENRIIDCNIEAMNMMGCREKSQLVQKFIHDFSPEVQPDGESSKMKGRKYAKLALQQRNMTFEWQYRRLDGGSFMAEIVMTAIPMSGQNILHANLRDITEQKRLQNEIINIIDVEQQRLGQNLHDGLGQDLTGVAFMCNTLAKKLKDLELPEAAISEEITGLVYKIITRVRMLSRELYPPNLVENEITYTLQQFAANTSSVFDISCTFSQDPDLVISDIFISTQIYYIVREAVNNSIKHGQARHIIISLTRDKNDVILVIEDDGIGRPETMDKYKGLGLRIMAYRMGTMNGTFTIFDNYKSGGVIVFCTFPVYKLQKEH
jgi:PAS domain S-box-containing protein